MSAPGDVEGRPIRRELGHGADGGLGDHDRMVGIGFPQLR